MSFIDTTRRAISGRDYDYDNRDYDEEYDEYEEEYEDKPRRNIFSLLFGTRNEDYDEYAEEEAEPKRERTSSYSNRSTASSARSAYSRAESASSYREKSSPRSSIRYGANLSGVEITVLSPVGFDDSAKIVREVKEGKITIFDVSEIAAADEARRIVDYICGAAEGMDCPFSRICPSIFCIAPKGVVLNNKKAGYR